MVRKKRAQKRTVKRVSRKASNSKNFGKNDVGRKISIVLNNLLLFVALSLVSFVLYRFLQNDILINLFYAMSMIFGFVSVGFLVTLLVLLIMKVVKKQ
jgi:hypothetical protein